MRHNLRIVGADKLNTIRVILHFLQPLDGIELTVPVKAITGNYHIVNISLREGCIGGQYHILAAVNAVTRIGKPSRGCFVYHNRKLSVSVAGAGNTKHAVISEEVKATAQGAQSTAVETGVCR